MVNSSDKKCMFKIRRNCNVCAATKDPDNALIQIILNKQAYFT